jgi:hypothetical protein
MGYSRSVSLIDAVRLVRMVSEKLTHAELAGRLDDALERVHQGDRFMIERDGDVSAEIVLHSDKLSITLGEFLAKYGDFPRPDPGFADDLEAVMAEMRPEHRPPNPPD